MKRLRDASECELSERNAKQTGLAKGVSKENTVSPWEEEAGHLSSLPNMQPEHLKFLLRWMELLKIIRLNFSNIPGADLENLGFGPKPSTTCLESEHWRHNAYISLLGLHIGSSERLRFGLALAVYILQTQGRMTGGTEPERECWGDGDGRNYFQLRRLNSKSCWTWGPLAPRDSLIGTELRGPREDVCTLRVDEAWLR